MDLSHLDSILLKQLLGPSHLLVVKPPHFKELIQLVIVVLIHFDGPNHKAIEQLMLIIGCPSPDHHLLQYHSKEAIVSLKPLALAAIAQLNHFSFLDHRVIEQLELIIKWILYFDS